MHKRKLTSGFMLALLFASILSLFSALLVHAQGTTVYVDPSIISDTSLVPPKTFTIDVKLSDVANLYGFEFRLFWNKTILSLNKVQFSLPWSPNFVAKNETLQTYNSTSGRYWLGASGLAPAAAFTGSTTLATLTFKVVGMGETPLELAGTKLGDPSAAAIPHDRESGVFRNTTPPSPDFSVSSSLPSLTIAQGASGTSIITVTSMNGFNSAVALSVSGAPETVTTSLSPNSVTPPSGGTATSTLTINVGASTPADGYTLTVLGTSGQLTHQVTIRLTVTALPPPPTPTTSIQVKWANFTNDPKFPFGGQYDNGMYPVWKKFIVLNGGDEQMTYVSVRYPAATPAFKPSRYMIETNPSSGKWAIAVNLEDRLIEFTAQDEGIVPRGFAVVSIEFIQGPTAEDVTVGNEFAVTVTDPSKSSVGVTFYLLEYIDKTPPTVDITFPEATTAGGLSYSFIKRSDGFIWVLMPNSTNRKIRSLWINGTASDSGSGINRVEIWINNTYMGDAALSRPIGSKSVTWSWFTDPTKNPIFWKIESWFSVTAKAFDNSVNDESTYRHGSDQIPLTNNATTVNHWLFWIGTEGGREVYAVLNGTENNIVWVPGNGRLDVWGKTGFYPNLNVEIWLSNDLYGANILIGEVTADNNGRFYKIINHLPEVPRTPSGGGLWNVTAIQHKGDIDLKAADQFAIIPWITFENTMSRFAATDWITTKSGHVGDTITVYGHGFLPSRQTKWDPYSTVYVDIIYTDIAPLANLLATQRSVWNGTSQYNIDVLEWTPRLSEVVLASIATNGSGFWSAQITIPPSFGGLHAIYANESAIKTDIGRTGPIPTPRLVKSGWPELIPHPCEEQAVIFDVWPTINVSPSTAMPGQYVTVTGEGLPLPKYYTLLKNNKMIEQDRDRCLVINFGPQMQWIFENRFIRNNEFDQYWMMGQWYPFSFYMPDIANHARAPLESPVWSGKLSSVTLDHVTTPPRHYHILGSQYLKIPMLPPGEYSVAVCYWGKNTEAFITNDHNATTTVNIIKDPLNVNVQAGTIHFPGEIATALVKTDVDGSQKDADVDVALYLGSTFVQKLTCTRIDTGFYIATFTVPNKEGNYFVTAAATKAYDSFMTLHGVGTSGFTVSPTLDGYDAKLTSLNSQVATLNTTVGKMNIPITDLQAQVIAISGKILTLNTTLGKVKANVDSLNGALTSLNGDVATIKTNLGSVNATLRDIGTKISINGGVATITTDLTTVKGKLTSIEGNVATIQTAIGTVKSQIDSIKGDTTAQMGLQPTAIGLSIIAAIAAIAAVALILRKVYLK